MYALVDCNNFYASCERVFRPDLMNQPIVVLSNNDGCVIARSNEAKTLGVPMGAPAYQYRDVFDKHHIQVFSSNYPLYGDMSRRVMKSLSHFASDMEIYSIDEAFLLFNNLIHRQQSFVHFASHIRSYIKKNTGIPICIGVAPSKTLAKTANKIAKKFPEKTNGVYVIDSEIKRINALKWQPVQDVWGIGRRFAEQLAQINVKSAYDFTCIPDNWIKKHMSIVGLRLKKELLGMSAIKLEEVPPAKKMIATTRSFEKYYTELHEIEERVSTFTSSCAEKLRRQQSCCNAILLFIQTPPYRKELPQYNPSITLQCPYPTSSSFVLINLALKGLRRIYKKGFSYKKAGIIALDIVPHSAIQLSMFDQPNIKHQALLKTVDTINKNASKPLVKFASQDLKVQWKMKQEKHSPRYTTDIREIIQIDTALS
jgi:DNA polymerase V